MSQEVTNKLPSEHLHNTLKHVLETLNLDPESEYSVTATSAYVISSRGYKVCVSLDDGSTLPLFFKCMPDNETFNESLDLSIFFRNEVSVYNKVLGAFRDLQTRRLGSTLYEPSPRCYHAGEEVMVLEDLEVGGFRMLDRLRVMALPELRLLLQQLGRFHALSMAVRHLEPELFGTIKSAVHETMYYPKFLEKYGQVFEYAGRDAFRLVKEAFPNDPDNAYVEAMRKFADNLCDNMAAIVGDASPEDEEHFVVTHGDLWINNFMFRYPEGADSPDALRIVDYQVCRYGSPALDVSCVLLSSADPPTREQHWDLLIRTYHDSVSDVLVNLGLDPGAVFPRATLQRHLVKYSRFGVGMCVANLPLTLDERKGSDDIEEPHDCGTDLILASRTAPYRRKSQMCCRWVVDNIVEAVDRGYLRTTGTEIEGILK